MVQYLERTHIVTSGEAAAGVVSITEPLGTLRMVRILSMGIYDRSDLFAAVSIGVTIGNTSIALKERIQDPYVGLHLDNSRETFANTFVWTVRRPTTSDNIAYSVEWEEI